MSACQFQRGDSVQDINFASPKSDECQFFTDPTVEHLTGGPDSDQYQCLILPRKGQEASMAEIRPVSVSNELGSSLPSEPWPGNSTHTTTRLTYTLPAISLANIGARRVTIGGLFFGPDTNGYLDAEAMSFYKFKSSSILQSCSKQSPCSMLFI